MVAVEEQKIQDACLRQERQDSLMGAGQEREGEQRGFHGSGLRRWVESDVI